MADEIRQIKIRRDASTVWASVNPILAAGELAFDTTLRRLKVGDGSNAWSALPWSSMDASEVARLEAAADALDGAATPYDAATATVLGMQNGAARKVLTDTIDAAVEPLVAEAIGEDPTVVNAAASAVGGQVALRHLIGSNELYDADVTTFTDENGFPTSFEFRNSDGKPTPRMAADIAAQGSYSTAGASYDDGIVFVDQSGVPIPDAAYDERGNLRGDVVERLTNRLDAHRSPRAPRQVKRLPSAVDAKLLQAANQATKYLLGTWLPARFPGTAAITPAQVGANGTGADEHQVRHPAAAAFSIAALLYTQTYDPAVTGVAAADAKTAAIRVVRGLALAHRSTTSGGWGQYWQASLWAQMIDAAAWMLGADIDPTTRGYVDSMVAMEAAFVLAYSIGGLPAGTPPYWTRYDGTVLFPGDSKSEENAWMGGFLAWASVAHEAANNAGTWRVKSYDWLLSSTTKPSDITTSVSVQGRRPGDIFDGWNIRQDGAVINHDRIHPDYMCSIPELQWSAGILWAHAGRRLPAIHVHNAEDVYFALAQRVYNGRPIYTPGSSFVFDPQDSDWGTSRYADKAMADVLAHCLGLDSRVSTPAATWADLHLQKCLEMQARFTDGHTYANTTEDSYQGAEPWVARNFALAVLAARIPTTSRYTYAEIGA